MELSRRGFIGLLGVVAAAVGLGGHRALVAPEVTEATRMPFENNSMVQMFGDVPPVHGNMGDIWMSIWPGTESVYRYDGTGWEMIRDLPRQQVSDDLLMKLPMLDSVECGHLRHMTEGDPTPLNGWTVAASQPEFPFDDAWVEAHNDENAARMREAAARADAAIAEEVSKIKFSSDRAEADRQLQAARYRALGRIGVI